MRYFTKNRPHIPAVKHGRGPSNWNKFQWVASATSLITLGLLLSLGNPKALDAEMITVNMMDNAKNIRTASGDSFSVELNQAGAAGYTWEIQNLDSEHLEVLETKAREPIKPEDLTGAPVKRSWIIKTKMAGHTELRICHFRPWEGIQNAIETFILTIEID
ncbi:MAG: protease inhibitor I42 family protein [Desulfobacteraceae bacterium]|nr:protease inhibitor I42 family protein [Desulfobacteraceae bacterium]MBU4054572.1 protease inhibitor I42 family protein [Pseudomonadota bacterium]